VKPINPRSHTSRRLELFALLFFLLPALLMGQSLKDRFGRDLLNQPITLVDWEGYMANPAIKLTVTPPLGVNFPYNVTITANHARLYFDWPGTAGANGPSRVLSFNTDGPKDFFVSIFPDRDGDNEEYTLTLNSTSGTLNYALNVIDHDKAPEGDLLNIITDYSTDTQHNFLNDDYKTIIRRAADDWSFFIEDRGYDEVAALDEQTFIWGDEFTSGNWVSNSAAYQGFLIKFHGTQNAVHRSGGGASNHAFQTVNGQETELRRSGEVVVEIHGNYNALGWDLSITDDQWYKATNLGDVQNDLYSIMMHEMGHSLGFNDAYPKFQELEGLGEITSGPVFDYQHSAIPISASDDHLGPYPPVIVDRISKKGVFGQEYAAEMPQGRWLISKLNLLVLERIGHKIRRTSAFDHVAITTTLLPEAVAGEYDASLVATGGVPFYNFEIVDGVLPAGLTLNSFTGKITGTLTQSSEATFIVKVTDYDGEAVTKQFTLGEVAMSEQSITFHELPEKHLGDGAFELHAEATSNLPITFTSSNEAVATIAGNVVTIHEAGIATITASQNGNDIFLAAEPVERILQVRVAGLARHFDFHRIILDDNPPTLSTILQGVNKDNGAVIVNGVDTAQPAGGFTFIWGDGTQTLGGFPGSHMYADHSKNYVCRVVAHYSETEKDTSDVVIEFGAYDIQPVSVDPKTKVFIPADPLTFAGTRLYDPPTLTPVAGVAFVGLTRQQVEYILSVASSIGLDFVNGDVYQYDDKFEQYMLKAGDFGGAFSIWYTNPVAFGVGETMFFGGDVDLSSFIHEMGHNYTLNMPADYYYGGRVDGNANAIYSEAMANIFAHAVGYEVMNNSADYGLGDDAFTKLKQKLNSSANVIRTSYDRYIDNGKNFQSWNDIATGIDETFDTFMTIAYKFMQHAEQNGHGYRDPFKRMASILQKFNADYALRYDAQNDSQSGATFRSTLMVAAMSYAFDEDLRDEFIDLHFPIDTPTYNELLDIGNKADQEISFDEIDMHTFGDEPFELHATNNSGLTILFESSNLAVATVQGNIVTIVAAGETEIKASQPGNLDYNAAAIVTRNLVIDKANQVITFPEIEQKAPGADAFNLSASSSAQLPVSYESSNTAVATINENVVTIVGAGETIITATQPGNNNYYPAEDVSRTLVVVAKTNQTITFPEIPNKTLGGTAFTLQATASSTLSVQYSTTSDKATIAGSQVTLVKAGRLAIKASQEGNAQFNAATPVERSFCINPAKPVITASAPGTEPPVLTSSSASGNQWFKDGEPMGGKTNATLTIESAGAYTVKVTVDDCVSEVSEVTNIVITGVERRFDPGVRVYPNPIVRASGHHELNVDLQEFQAEPVQLSLTDMSGRNLERRATYGGRVETIDMSAIVQGLYVVRVQSREGLMVVRVLVK
jgi:hypothetical protein